MQTLLALVAIASQDPPIPAALANDPVLWPYLTAIAALAAVVVTLFGVIMKLVGERDKAASAQAEKITKLVAQQTADNKDIVHALEGITKEIERANRSEGSK